MRIVLHRDDFSQQRVGDAGFASLSGGGLKSAATLLAFPTQTRSLIEVELEDDSTFEGEVLIGEEAIGFEIRGMMNADELHIRFVSPTRVEASLQVSARDTPARPRPRCADGTEGYPCVTCATGSGTVRICC